VPSTVLFQGMARTPPCRATSMVDSPGPWMNWCGKARAAGGTGVTATAGGAGGATATVGADGKGTKARQRAMRPWRRNDGGLEVGGV
jgi:hypothetical protein